MSWDVLVLKISGEAFTVDELPEDDVLDAIGPLPEVLDRLREQLPGVDLSDPEWGHLEAATWSIELNVGDDDPVKSVMLHVRGTGDDVVPVITEMAEMLGCRAFDITTERFLHAGDTAGWHAFQEYRNGIVSRPA
ncbi:hypothetical protein Aph01nite_66690 [Acrocarpospora phusangensis]|uniref:Uncharacterized protein n=1 Tax=Acrocarpospora phusangensis TaxID=1070424 RepID=A0A919QI01_9ACTN|nr:hypothetical protein [Acrocarpospora phusangensis]GIH28359.1 hypothetical protein Aph01nite_66690 [Acrocarpospora phusangensis]